MPRCRTKPAWRMLALSLPVVLPAAARAATVTTIATIPGTGDGAEPVAALTRFEGAYYGITAAGGGTQGYNSGTVFRIDLRTGAEKIVYRFTGGADGGSPLAALTVVDGTLYGSTTAGGAHGGGVVFSIDPATGVETVVTSFPTFTVPRGALVPYGGLLYGTGNYCSSNGKYEGCIFVIDPNDGNYTMLHGFASTGHDGILPGSLLLHNGDLFGTTGGGGQYRGGTLFRFDPKTNAFKVEHQFATNGDGLYPASTLTELGGLIYGTTEDGGSTNAGTIFSFDPAGREEAVLHSFAAADGVAPVSGLLDVGGVLYGTTLSGGTASSGTVFSFDPATPQLNVLHNFSAAEGGQMVAPFIAANGALYGAKEYGGPGGRGTDGQIFAVDIATGQFTTLHDFGGSEDSADTSALTKAGSALYGASYGGGPVALGSIFKVAPNGGTIETVYGFQGTDGALPAGGLLDVAGTLYGTTYDGGANDLGTLFAFDTAKRKLTTLHAFAGADGDYPSTSLALMGNTAYGTTSAGGGEEHGVVFSLDLGTLQQTTVASFDRTTGYPGSALTLLGGTLYGVAYSGGAQGYGTIFALDTGSGKLTAVYTFQGGDDGAHPEGGLCAYGGLLYGAATGDQRTAATLFSFDPATGTKTTLHTLKRETTISGAMVAKGDKLFGTLQYGPRVNAPYGGVFRLDPATGHTMIYPFAAGASTSPNAALAVSPSGLFGTTPSNTGANAGTVYKFVP